MEQWQQEFYDLITTGNSLISMDDIKRALSTVEATDLSRMRNKIRSHDFYHVNSKAAIISFTNLRESGLSAEDAAAAVALATGEVPAKAWDHPDNLEVRNEVWGEPSGASWSFSKEPKKKLPFYHGKRRF